MSYDIHVCFPHADFPLAELREVLAAFGLRTGESPNKPYWSIRLDAGRIVSLDRREITARYPGSTCFPPNTRWNVVVSTSAGRTDEARAVQFAVPYVFLARVRGVSVHDCQRHSAGVFTDPDRYLVAFGAFLDDLPPVSRKRLEEVGLFHDGRLTEADAATGDVDAMSAAGFQRWRAGDLNGARRWLQRAAGCGDPRAAYHLIFLLEELGDLAGARAWLERAVAGGDSRAAEYLDLFLEIHGPVEHSRDRAAGGTEREG